QADKVIEFLPANSPEAEQLNKEYVLIKEKEKQKYLPGQIVDLMQEEGYIHFKQYQHTILWKSKEAKVPAKGFGVQVAQTWYWYDLWLKEVRKHCQDNAERYVQI
ncbi:hypothetical protein, partial [Methylophaga muralis]|uniref:hypothetical protein n=1 Tax=Methylophaga muralis TaxID=291169 RepID=UPI000B175CA8